MLRQAVLKGQDHSLQAPAIHPSSSDPVKMDLFTLTIGTHTFDNGKPARLSPASSAIISPGARLKAIPAILAQIVIGFAYASAAMRANSGPKELVETL